MELIDKNKLMVSLIDADLDQHQSEKTGEELCEIIESQPTVDAIPRETLKNIVYSYKMLDKRFEELTPFEDRIICLICQIDVQHWKLWAGEYDNE